MAKEESKNPNAVKFGEVHIVTKALQNSSQIHHTF